MKSLKKVYSKRKWFGAILVGLLLLPSLGWGWDLRKETWDALPGPRDYRPILGWTQVKQQRLLAIRTWQKAGKTYLLVVNPDTAVTQIVQASLPPSTSWPEAQRADPQGLYFKLRAAAQQNSSETINAGVGVWKSPRRGAWLSMDLCPSRKPLDRWIFTSLTQARTQPLPVFLDVSGLWMSVHAHDLSWLIHQQKLGRLAITWVGHGELHPFEPDSPWNQTFDLTPGLDFHREVLGPERRLLALGQIPSVWYRFPGLISSPRLVRQLLNWGLVPLASGAWLNKNQKAQPDEVVLVHANGNEERGLRLLQALDQKKRREGNWAWLGVSDF